MNNNTATSGLRIDQAETFIEYPSNHYNKMRSDTADSIAGDELRRVGLAPPL